MTKNILCFGDSNTWGTIALSDERYPRHVRWAGRLGALLGEGYHVVEEGLPGRTTVWDDPIEGDKAGLVYLRPCLASHAPLDLVCIMLGTNDTKPRFSLNACDIAQGAGTLVKTVQSSDCGPQGAPPQVLLIAPPVIHPGILTSELCGMFGGQRSRDISLEFAREYKKTADFFGCGFLDAALYAQGDPKDAVHLLASDHEALSAAVAAAARKLLE